MSISFFFFQVVQEANLQSIWLDGSRTEMEWTWINDISLGIYYTLDKMFRF